MFTFFNPRNVEFKRVQVTPTKNMFLLWKEDTPAMQYETLRSDRGQTKIGDLLIDGSKINRFEILLMKFMPEFLDIYRHL